MDASQVLKQYFGYDSFRKGQSDIIEAILQGQDALAIMPTGAGKSVCYQVPAMLLSGITIVISPLISLMQDQVKSLNEAGINAAYINSTLSEQQMYKALDYAAQGKYKIIYVAPERLETMSFMTFAQKADISMVTIDEAHCISQWGQDFRPSYLKIVDFIDSLPERPVVSAFTATATSEVKTDIPFGPYGARRRHQHHAPAHRRRRDARRRQCDDVHQPRLHGPRHGLRHCRRPDGRPAGG